MRFNSILRGLAPLLLAVTLGGVQAQEQGDLQKIKADKVVHVGAVEAPPWYDKDIQTGQWKGLVPDVMAAIFGKEGIEVDYVETQWGTAVAGLQSGRFDLIGAYNETPERAKSIDFTRRMGALKFSVLTFADDARPYQSWDAMNDPAIRLAAIDGAGATRALQPVMPKTSWVVVQSSDQMFMQLESGRADALVTSDVQIAKYLAARGRGKMTTPTPVRSQPTNIGLRKSDGHELRDWLDARIEGLEADGTIERIWAKYTQPAQQSK